MTVLKYDIKEVLPFSTAFLTDLAEDFLKYFFYLSQKIGIGILST